MKSITFPRQTRFFTRPRPLLGSALSIALLALAPQARSADSDNDGVADQADLFPCDPGPTGVIYAPAQGQHAMMLFEDQWPSKGDNDFNDVIITYNYALVVNAQGQVLSVRATFNVPAVGGQFDNGFGLQLPVPTNAIASITRQVGSSGSMESLTPRPEDATMVVRVSENLRELFDNQEGVINSDPQRPALTSQPIEVNIRFASPVSFNTGLAPFDLFIFRSDAPSYQIHRPEYPGTASMNQDLFGSQDDASTLTRHFVDTDGLPYALNIPALVPWSSEAQPITNLFPNLVGFAASGGTQNQDFYVQGVDASRAYRPSDSTVTLPSASFVSAPELTGNRSCVPLWPGSVQLGSVSTDNAGGVTSDPSSNVIIAGYTSGTLLGVTPASASGDDYFVVKYSPAGQIIWQKQVGSATAGLRADGGVSTDAQGNIFAAGSSTGTMLPDINTAGFHGNNSLLVKYDPSGNLLWTRQFAVSGWNYCVGNTYVTDYDTGCDASARGVATDPSGNVYITGTLGRGTSLPGISYQGSISRVYTAKYNAQGTLLWVRAYAPTQYYCRGTGGIGVDAAGAVYVAASVDNGNPGGMWTPSPTTDYMLIKYDANGNLQWTARSPTTATSTYSTQPTEVTVSSNAVFISGSTNFAALDGAASNGSWDMFVVKYSLAGARQWTRLVGTSASDTGTYNGGLASDTLGNVYVGGTTSGDFPGSTPATGDDYFIAKLDASGTRQWASQVRAVNNWASPRLQGMTTTPLGDLFATGYTWGVVAGSGATSIGSSDIFLAKHSALNGTLQ